MTYRYYQHAEKQTTLPPALTIRLGPPSRPVNATASTNACVMLWVSHALRWAGVVQISLIHFVVSPATRQVKATNLVLKS